MELNDPAHQQTQLDLQICGVLIYIHVSVSCNCSCLLIGRTGPSESPPPQPTPQSPPSCSGLVGKPPRTPVLHPQPFIKAAPSTSADRLRPLLNLPACRRPPDPPLIPASNNTPPSSALAADSWPPVQPRKVSRPPCQLTSRMERRPGLTTPNTTNALISC